MRPKEDVARIVPLWPTVRTGETRSGWVEAFLCANLAIMWRMRKQE